MKEMENKYNVWLKKAKDKSIIDELKSIEKDEKAIEDRFYKELAFGTGGLRGKLGAGTNRMNVYSVGKATFGLSDYIINSSANHSVAIAYDSRNKSKEFAYLVAEIMSSKGIKAYIFDTLMPTPVLSFTVRKFKAGCGIVITASHNPKEYNGYKVYNSLGCQITDEVASEVTEYIKRYDYFNEYTPNKELITEIGEEVLDEFIETVLNYSLEYKKEYLPKSIVYSPLCGTGNIPVQKLFSKLNITNYTIVPEQREPNGDFTTCPFPNPEEKSALELSLKLAKERNAELVIATDPDADRVGIAVRDKSGEYVLLSGNETGVLMENYILSVKETPKNSYIVKTIVTSPLAESVAKEKGVEVKNVLTGFKYIGETIDKNPNKNYLFGMEESYGYLVGTHVRDKDAISAVMIIVEAYAYYKEKGLSLIEGLESLYKKFGYYETGLYYKVYEGKDGQEKMNGIIASLREVPLKEIVGEEVEEFIDYGKGIDGLPKSNVLVFKGIKFSLIVRPSGTEPKIKIYLTANEKTKEKSKELLNKLLNFAKDLLK